MPAGPSPLSDKAATNCRCCSASAARSSGWLGASDMQPFAQAAAADDGSADALHFAEEGGVGREVVVALEHDAGDLDAGDEVGQQVDGAFRDVVGVGVVVDAVGFAFVAAAH